mgnify:CR=1 FL=1
MYKCEIRQQKTGDGTLRKFHLPCESVNFFLVYDLERVLNPNNV